MAYVAKKIIRLCLKIAEYDAFKTSNVRLLDQIVVIRDALDDADWS